MENYIGKTCPFCKTVITETDSVKVCPACGIPHHEACWNENRGCTTFGCSEQHYEAQNTNPTNVCGKCGAPLGQGQEFCPRCGQKAGLVVDTNVSQAIYQFNNGVQQAAVKKNKMPLIITVAAIAVVGIILAVVFLGGGGSGSKGPNFKKIYNEYCSYEWADYGSDGSYLSIDTNPDDEDDTGIAYIDAYYAVENVNKALGLPDSLFKDMGETTGNDGKQTETFKEQGVTVSWKYHPDKGLEVTYKKAN